MMNMNIPILNPTNKTQTNNMTTRIRRTIIKRKRKTTMFNTTYAKHEHPHHAPRPEAAGSRHGSKMGRAARTIRNKSPMV